MRKLLVTLAAACALSACDQKSSLYLEPGRKAQPSAAKSPWPSPARPQKAAAPAPPPAPAPARTQAPPTP
jgi:predicted small lipoprotein YifL